MPISETYNMDCIEYMRQFPDKHFELAVVDPPYGINFGEFNRTNKTSNGTRKKANKYKQSNWDDSIPGDDYFFELFRVSKNQIVWGGNYFPQTWANKPCKGFIFWYKQNPVDNFSDGELAWTSFDCVARCFDFRYFGNLEGKNTAEIKHHPTQKPVALYKWLLSNYAKPGDKILDTHLGSGSSRIAAYDMGFDFYATELDKDYFDAQEKRFQNFKAQLKLF